MNAPAKGWSWVDAAGREALPTLPTESASVVCEPEVSALRAAVLQGDGSGLAVPALDWVLPRYPIEVRRHMLEGFGAGMRRELASITRAARPGALLGEIAEQRVRAKAEAAERLEADSLVLLAAHCDLAFDDDEIDRIADKGAELCRFLSMALPGRVRAEELAAACLQVRKVLRVGRWGEQRAQVAAREARLYAGLASVVSVAIKGAREHEGSAPELAPAYGACAALARFVGIEPPLPGVGDRTVAGALWRLRDAAWWRHRLAREWFRASDSALRHVGQVSRFKGLYVADPTFARVNRQRIRSASWMESMFLVSENDEVIPLKDAVDASVSNPELRRKELLARMGGCERYARAQGDEVIVANITLPARFHRIYAASGDPVPAFDGSDVRDGAIQLQASWQRARAALHRQGVGIYGYRCSEPNHDGTVHWHVMLCCLPDHAEAVRDAIRRYFLAELDPDEPGAQEHRIEFIGIDPGRGSAVGYLMKYIAKNIDGHEVGEDRNAPGQDAADTCHRAVAHHRTHGLRQFQEFGMPPVTVWRELRRLTESPGGELDALWRAASVDSNWEAFIRLMGGAAVRRSCRPVSPYYAPGKAVGRYGERPAKRVRGLRCANVIVPTRRTEWQLMAKRRLTPTWTRGINCTHGPELIGDDGVPASPESPPGARGPPDLDGLAAAFGGPNGP